MIISALSWDKSVLSDIAWVFCPVRVRSIVHAWLNHSTGTLTHPRSPNICVQYGCRFGQWKVLLCCSKLDVPCPLIKSGPTVRTGDLLLLTLSSYRVLEYHLAVPFLRYRSSEVVYQHLPQKLLPRSATFERLAVYRLDVIRMFLMRASFVVVNK